MLDALSLPFAQRALVELAFLSVAAGVLGTWIVLRGLAFFTHAVGTATFPGLVLAGGLGFAPTLGAAATGLACAVGVAVLARRRPGSYDAVTALVLAGALAAGVVLASDVLRTAPAVDGLLFGSLLLVDSSDIVLAVVAAVLVLVFSAVAGPRWLATGFDPGTAPALGARPRTADAVLLALIAFVALASLSAVGALLATALLVVPAATTRLLVRRVGVWQMATVALTLVLGTAGVALSVETDAPPGATIAVLAGGAFALAAAVRLVRDRRRAGAVAAAATIALVAAGCGEDAGGTTGQGGGDGPVVVATTTHLGDLARAVAGDRAEVVQLLQPNTDPHDYEPRPGDVRRVAEAAVVVRSGDGLDAWADEVVEQSGGDPEVVDAGEGRPHRLAAGEEEHAGEEEQHGEEPRAGEEEQHGDADPHWWHDPRNVRHAVERIAGTLSGADPQGRTVYQRNAEAYVRRLQALDARVERCFDAIPAERRKLVTDHDAFGHLADRYGLEVVGAVVPATTTQAQASAGEVAELARTIRRERVSVVFPEASLEPRLARAIARRTGARLGGGLYADALGPEGSPGTTYLGAHQANADTLVRGLTDGSRGCPAP